jgi:Arc/MetJ family transcription regulator
MTLNVDESLLAEVVEAHPGVTKTALVEQGLRALLAARAAERLAAMGGTAKRARRPKRSAHERT